MHVNVVVGGQLDEHLFFWQPTISITLYVYFIVYLFKNNNTVPKATNVRAVTKEK